MLGSREVTSFPSDDLAAAAEQTAQNPARKMAFSAGRHTPALKPSDD